MSVNMLGPEGATATVTGSKLLDECRSMLARLGLYRDVDIKDSSTCSPKAAVLMRSSTSKALGTTQETAWLGAHARPHQQDRRLTDQGAHAGFQADHDITAGKVTAVASVDADVADVPKDTAVGLKAVHQRRDQESIPSAAAAAAAAPIAAVPLAAVQESEAARPGHHLLLPTQARQPPLPPQQQQQAPHPPRHSSLGGASSSSHSSWGTPSSSSRPSLAGSEQADENLLRRGVLPVGRRSISISAPGLAPTPIKKPSRPALVPPLNLAQLPSSPGPDNGNPAQLPTASKQLPGSCYSLGGSWSQRGFVTSEESEEDMEAELASYLAPPKWMPTNEGRWYVHKPVSSQEAQRYQALVQGLPPQQGRCVSQLLQSLLQAQYSCELMASRGVRVAKDITLEWSRLAGGLLDRIEGYELNMARLQKQVDDAQQCACMAESASACGSQQGPASRSDRLSRRGTMGGASREHEEEQLSWDQLYKEYSLLSCENMDLKDELDSLQHKYKQAFHEVGTLHQELQDQEALVLEQGELLQQQGDALQRQLQAELQQQRSCLEEQQAAAWGREQQLLQEVAELKAALAQQQQVGQRQQQQQELTSQQLLPGHASASPFSHMQQQVPLLAHVAQHPVQRFTDAGQAMRYSDTRHGVKSGDDYDAAADIAVASGKPRSAKESPLGPAAAAAMPRLAATAVNH